MTKRDTGNKPAAALSPYLSLRESVRPAIFAYNLLEREQGRAGVLAQEINTLLKATEDLLESAGLFHMLSPGPLGDADPVPDDSSHQARLVEAYSQAGMKWARIVGSCLNLADALLAEDLWDDAHRLADYVKDAGEPGVAADITARTNAAQQKVAAEMRAAQEKAAAEAVLARYKGFRERLNNEMPPADIVEVFSIYRSAVNYPNAARNVRDSVRGPLIESIANYYCGAMPSDANDKPAYVQELEKQFASKNGWKVALSTFESIYKQLG